MAAILDSEGNGRETIVAILNLHVATMPPTKFQLNPTFTVLEEMSKMRKANDGLRTDEPWTDNGQQAMT